MSGADLRERGLRNPRHTFAVAQGGRYIQPLFVAPIRPAETMIGLRMRANSYSWEKLRVGLTLPIEVEYCVWKVSVRQIGDFFVDLFVNDAGDEHDYVNAPTGVRIAGLPVADHGHKSRTPLQTKDRLWAGETGQITGDVALQPHRAYAPYVSHAIWHIARMCYDLEIGDPASEFDRAGTSFTFRNTLDWGDPNLFTTAPYVGRLVRSATSSAVGAGLGPDVPPTTGSLADWAERLSLLDNPNRTYYDYLKAFGVHPSRIPGMPEPVLMQRRTLQPYGSPDIIHQPQTFTTAPGQPSGYAGPSNTHRITMDPNQLTNNNNYTLVDGNSYQMYRAAIDETRGKRLMVDEPSFLIGTCCWWPYDFDLRAAAHVFDAVYMINSGTWGDPSAGSPDERDFLITRDIKRAISSAGGWWADDGQTYAPHNNDQGLDSPFAINMLNLFLNGDTYTHSPTLFGHHRSFEQPVAGGSESPGDSLLLDHTMRVITQGDVRIGVATDLVQ